jgi:nucleotide-binding universal stress UspA family protein
MLRFRVTDTAGESYIVQTDGSETADLAAKHAIETQVGVTVADVVPMCAWFALCENDAAVMISAPIALHGVPTCQRCHDKVAALGDVEVLATI